MRFSVLCGSGFFYLLAGCYQSMTEAACQYYAHRQMLDECRHYQPP